MERISKNLCLVEMFTDIYDSALGKKKQQLTIQISITWWNG